MKFAEHLAAHITPEWRKQYISYEEMKAMLYAAVEQAPSPEVTEAEVITRYYARFDEQFFRVCDKELAKINTFFSEKMAEATRKYTTLKSDLLASKEQYGDGLRNRKGLSFLPKLNVPARKMQDLKLAFSEFYLSLILLQNYQNLNFTGFRKILKKHDKLLTTHVGAKWREENVDSCPFNTNKDIDKLIQEVENTVTTELERGDRTKAMKRLRVPPLGETQSPWTTFKVGLFMGAFIVLLVSVALSLFFRAQDHNSNVVIRLFRAPFLIILFNLFIGANIYGWRSSGVNHVLIFEIDPRNHLTEQHLAEIAAIFGVIWAMSVMGFLYADALAIPPYSVPLALLCFMVTFMLNPSRTFHHEARFWLLRKLGRIFCAPFFFVQFADFWIGDQLNTLVQVLKDFEYSLCYYLTIDNWYTSSDITNNLMCTGKAHWMGNIVGCLPAWWRFAQCLRRYRDTKEMFPHLVNAFKYCTTFFVVIFSVLFHQSKENFQDNTENPFFYMMILSMLFASCFVLWWDLVMDWGLFDKSASEYKFLREELVYSSPLYRFEVKVFQFNYGIVFLFKCITTFTGAISSSSSNEVFQKCVITCIIYEGEIYSFKPDFRRTHEVAVVVFNHGNANEVVKALGCIIKKLPFTGGRPLKLLNNCKNVRVSKGEGEGEELPTYRVTVIPSQYRSW
ncbi:unnamed protein product, partial [Meganyctiphanes norvegica]